MLFEPVGTAPGVALSSIVSGLWIGASFLPRWRATLLEIGRLLIARIGFVVWLLAALLLLLLAATRGSLGLGLAISAALLTAAAAAEALRRDRTRFAFTLVLLALNAVLLVALNAFVGAFVLPARSHNNVVTEHDPLLGWKLRRGLSIERHRDAYSSRETINRHGFRTAERPFEKPAGTQRIVLLGDSHTEAYTVNDDETYAVLLEQELSADRPVEVIALGVGGYSTDQELLAYLNLGRRFQPDVVVLQFCMNDLPYNVLEHYWRGRKPRFERYGDALMLTGVPVPNLRNTGLFGSELISRWSLVLFLETALRQLAIKRDVEEKVDPRVPGRPQHRDGDRTAPHSRSPRHSVPRYRQYLYGRLRVLLGGRALEPEGAARRGADAGAAAARGAAIEMGRERVRASGRRASRRRGRRVRAERAMRAR
jgi:hypothetical protein